MGATRREHDRLARAGHLLWLALELETELPFADGEGLLLRVVEMHDRATPGRDFILDQQRLAFWAIDHLEEGQPFSVPRQRDVPLRQTRRSRPGAC